MHCISKHVHILRLTTRRNGHYKTDQKTNRAKDSKDLPALLLNKIIPTLKGLVTTTGIKGQLHFGSREKRAVPVMAILQAGAAIGVTLIKGINALVDAKEQNHLIMHSKWSQQR